MTDTVQHTQIRTQAALSDLPDPLAVMNSLVEAGELIINIRKTSGLDVTAKQKPTDLVTNADHAAQEFLITCLNDLRPGAIFVVEEATTQQIASAIKNAATAEWSWIIDPIDGTTSFIEGLPGYGLQAALCHKGQIVGGWIHCPELGKSAYAIEGQPVTMIGFSPMKSFPDLSLSKAHIVLACNDFEPSHKAHAQALSNEAASCRRTFSCAVDYMETLEGKRDLLIYRRSLPWDHAPGAYLVERIGGSVHRFDGSSYSPFSDKQGVLATRQAANSPLIMKFVP